MFIGFSFGQLCNVSIVNTEKRNLDYRHKTDICGTLYVTLLVSVLFLTWLWVCILKKELKGFNDDAFMEWIPHLTVQKIYERG